MTLNLNELEDIDIEDTNVHAVGNRFQTFQCA